MRWRSPWSQSRKTPGHRPVQHHLHSAGKAETSLRLIRSQGYERVMIFCNTKHMCQRLSDEFQRAGLDCDCIHGDIRQSQRKKTMQRYRDGKLAVLIATDVAPVVSTWTMWTALSTMTCRRRTSTTSTALAAPRRRKKGVAWSIVSNFPEEARLMTSANTAILPFSPW